jgi:transposase
VIDLGGRVRVFAHAAPCDMRKGFNTLAGLVTMGGHDVVTGDVFLFVAKNRKRAKCLWFDGTGACLLTKRLDAGRFAALWRDDGEGLQLSPVELRLFLDGSKVVGKIALVAKPVDRKAQGQISSTDFR